MKYAPIPGADTLNGEMRYLNIGGIVHLIPYHTNPYLHNECGKPSKPSNVGVDIGVSMV